MNLTKNCRKTLSVKITNIFSAIWTARTRGLGQSSTSSQPHSQSEVVSLASFTPKASRRHVLNVGGVVVVDFFVFFCGNVAFTVSKLIDYYKQKTQYRKQSEIKSQNQEGSGSKTCGFALSVCEFVFKQLAVCCCFPCTVGWLVS